MRKTKAADTDYGRHLGKDPKMAMILAQTEPMTLQVQDQLFFRLCRSIIGQQLSVKVAKVIEGRFLDFFGGQAPNPSQILEADSSSLRSIGLSQAKYKYLNSWAQYALDTNFEDEQLLSMTDEEVRGYLLPVPGIGNWTVDMVLLFSLGRADVWPIDDLGIRLSAEKLWEMNFPKGQKGRKLLLDIAEPWKPYRSFAALHLWHYRDNPW